MIIVMLGRKSEATIACARASARARGQFKRALADRARVSVCAYGFVQSVEERLRRRL